MTIKAGSRANYHLAQPRMGRMGRGDNSGLRDPGEIDNLPDSEILSSRDISALADVSEVDLETARTGRRGSHAMAGTPERSEEALRATPKPADEPPWPEGR